MNEMNRLNRLNQLWNWLPAFRAVAETENLREASDKIHTSPPALSRSIKLLEEALGRELFDRQGRGLRLNDRGERFLKTVRRAMRRLDDGLMEVRRDAGTVEWHVAIHPRIEWMAKHPNSPLVDFEPDAKLHIEPSWGPNVDQMLQSGELDLILSLEPSENDRLESDAVGALKNGLYCHEASDLLDMTPDERRDALEKRSFVAPNDRLGRHCDGWPADRGRAVEVCATRLSIVRQIALSRRLLAVLPAIYVDTLASSREKSNETLERVPMEGLEPTDVYALHRSSLGESSRWTTWIEDVATWFEGLES